MTIGTLFPRVRGLSGGTGDYQYTANFSSNTSGESTTYLYLVEVANFTSSRVWKPDPNLSINRIQYYTIVDEVSGLTTYTSCYIDLLRPTGYTVVNSGWTSLTFSPPNRPLLTVTRAAASFSGNYTPTIVRYTWNNAALGGQAVASGNNNLTVTI